MFNENVEYQYFMEFKDRTAAQVAGFFDTGVWERMVPQTCHQEESIRHITVALAALNMTIRAITDDSDAASMEARRREAWRHTAFGLKSYAKGLALMRRSTVTDLTDQNQLRVALLGCFITMTFEFYQGNKDASMKQAFAGIELLNNYHEAKVGVRPKSISDIPSTPAIEPDIIAAFAHMQNLLSLGKKKPDVRAVDLDELARYVDEIPVEFMDLEVARQSWEQTQDPEMFLRPEESKMKDYDFLFDISSPDFAVDKPLLASIPVKTESGDSPPKEPRVTIEDSGKEIGNARWLKAFEPLYNRCRSQPPMSTEFQEATILMLRYLTARLRTVYSYFDKDFVFESSQAMAIGRELLEMRAGSEEETLQQRTRFYKQGLVAALFLVAAKCQDRRLRREALTILEQYPGVEGYLDTVVAIRLARWFIEKDESIDLQSAVSRYVIEYVIALPDRAVSICLAKQMKNEPHRILMPPVTLRW
jgi:hypothetical protein